MNDDDIIARLRALADEEHQLRAGTGGVDTERVGEIEVLLDQCWDLLRQRRARREFGDDPDAATVRDAAIVENYQQ